MTDGALYLLAWVWENRGYWGFVSGFTCGMMLMAAVAHWAVS